MFKSFRDRQITKKQQKNNGRFRIIKSKNIKPVKAVHTDQDVFIENDKSISAFQHINRKNAFLVPNLSYYPRACYLPKNCIPDGSVAILYSDNDRTNITDDDLKFFSSDEFHAFYKIARNYGTRTLNIDSNSVFFFGLRKRRWQLRVWMCFTHDLSIADDVFYCLYLTDKNIKSRANPWQQNENSIKMVFCFFVIQ